jgi:ABC-2 type transport system ATP-binding protein
VDLLALAEANGMSAPIPALARAANALEIHALHAGYGAHAVLRGVELHVPAASWFCLLGPNGVGKSTLVHCLSGRVSAQRGSMRICGHSLQDEAFAARRKLGVACAPEQLPGLLTGWQCLEIYASAKGVNAIDPAVLELAEALHVMPYLERYVDSYSLGTRQKVCILLALIGEPELIVLDEAFNGLDPRSAMQLKQHLSARVAQQRCSILLATHSLDIVEHYGDAAALMLEGRIAHEWARTDLDRLRRAGGNALEQSLAVASGIAEPTIAS